MADRQQRIKTILADDSGGKFEQRRAIKQVFGETDAKINAVLTLEQQKSYAEIETQLRARM